MKKIQFAKRWLFCCCRWQIECRCLCSALNSSTCHKIANKMTKSIIFCQLTWSFYAIWHSHKDGRWKKNAKAQRPNTIGFSLSEWLKCTSLMQSEHRHLYSCHAFYLKLWSQERNEGVICLIHVRLISIFFSHSLLLLCASPIISSDFKCDSYLFIHNFRYNTILVLAVPLFLLTRMNLIYST